MQTKQGLVGFLIAAALLAPSSAWAFCGFYVGGAGSDMFADATQVVLMREATRTVLSMQNRYDGPIKDFALVIPVPVVLQEENVKTLEEDVFERVDMLTSPRLVEYWEKDPCMEKYEYDWADAAPGGSMNNASAEDPEEVVVEAQFKVGEYEIVVLSTTDSTALETWLDDNSYNIPDGAAPYFEPYVQSGMYFFVAKVDPAEVTFRGERAVLSPLRFHYDSEEFSLPVRLGMINSRGEQDLIVYTLGRNQRYELANYPNVTIPTNLPVAAEVKDDFASFYRALFARTLEENPGAAVTEYAWSTSDCDPCPGPVAWGLPQEDILTLGADVIPGEHSGARNWIITRLHMRYGADDLGQDLVFRKADPIVGGREIYGNDGLEEGAIPSSYNNFQGRYIIRHAWTGAVDCSDPVYGRWGGPSGGDSPSASFTTSPNTDGSEVFEDATDVDLDRLILTGSTPTGPGTPGPGTPGPGATDGEPRSRGCATADGDLSWPQGLLLFGLGLLGMRAIRRRSAQ